MSCSGRPKLCSTPPRHTVVVVVVVDCVELVREVVSVDVAVVVLETLVVVVAVSVLTLAVVDVIVIVVLNSQKATRSYNKKLQQH